jgi:hypothetical protein
MAAICRAEASERQAVINSDKVFGTHNGQKKPNQRDHRTNLANSSLNKPG